MQKENLNKYKGKYYILESIQGFENQNTRELSNEEYEDLLNANNILFEFKYFVQRFAEVKLNYENYFEIESKYYKQLEKLNNEERIEILDIVIVEINRVFINFITSFKTFIEQIEKRLKKKYGDESKELNEFKKLTNNLYDGYFSYKLFTRLRDFSLHYDYPIQHLDYNKEDSELYKLTPSFSKEILLKDKTLKNKIINNYDFTSRSEIFPVKPILNEFSIYSDTIIKKLIKIETERYYGAASLILDYIEHSQTKNLISIGYLLIDEKKNRYTWERNILQEKIATKIIKENYSI